MTLSARLICIVSASIGVAIVGLAVIMGFVARNALINQAEEQAGLAAGLIAGEANRAALVSDRIDRLLVEQMQSQAVAIAHLAAADRGDRAILSKRLSEITADTAIDDIRLLNRNGRQVLRAVDGLAEDGPDDVDAEGIDVRVLDVLTSRRDFFVNFQAAPSSDWERPMQYVGTRSPDGAVLVGSHSVQNRSFHDDIGLTATLKSLAGQPGIKTIWVVDDQLNILGTVPAPSLMNARQQPVTALPEADQALARSVLSSGIQSFLDDQALHVGAPIVDRGGVATGAAIIHMPRDRLNKLLERYVQYGLIVAGIAFAVGSLVALLSARQITRPVMALTRAAEAMDRRDFDPATLDRVGNRRDELGTLIRVFQTMARDVQARAEHLEALVRERTLDLEQKNEQLEQARQTMEQELRIAHSLQGAILPKTMPQSKAYSGSALMTPARELGGDFYDFFLLPDGRLGLVIADVSGKGVPAAFFMAIARTVMRTAANEHADAGACLREVNNTICEQNPHLLFVTLFYGILDPETGLLLYANAGHNPPYLVASTGAVTPIRPTGGVAIGVVPDLSYSEDSLTLVPGDRVFLYTDGISEAMNEEGEMFGEDRVEEVLSTGYRLPIEEVIGNVTLMIGKFVGGASQSDDITCIVLGYHGSPE